jgi:hypothetical protein
MASCRLSFTMIGDKTLEFSFTQKFSPLEARA